MKAIIKQEVYFSIYSYSGFSKDAIGIETLDFDTSSFFSSAIGIRTFAVAVFSSHILHNGLSTLVQMSNNTTKTPIAEEKRK